MSFLKDLWNDVKSVAPIVITIVAPELAPAIGAELGLTGAAAQAAGSAVISGGATALSGGSGSDILKSAAGGGVGSYVGGLAAEEVGKGTALGQAAKGFASGTTSGLIQGRNLGTALTQGAISGTAGYLFPESTKEAGVERALTSTALSRFLSPSVAGAGTTGATPTSVATTGKGTSPGSSALGQVLRTDVGAPIFGGSDKEEKTTKPGWNVESLRYLGSEA